MEEAKSLREEDGAVFIEEAISGVTGGQATQLLYDNSTESMSAERCTRGLTLPMKQNVLIGYFAENRGGGKGS